jgi:hypothetical protein
MQNTSHAVMSQRHEPHDSLDFFPTPPWAARALMEHVLGCAAEPNLWAWSRAWEPACGNGDMAKALEPYFGEVRTSDVHDYGWGHEVRDFLMPEQNAAATDWIITNPPFRLGPEFAITAIQRAKSGVAMLVRTAFLEGGKRHRELFAPHPPSAVAQFVERVPMFKGRLDPKGATATSYCWVVWERTVPWTGTRLVWIPPCRAKLERPGDYPDERMSAKEAA